MESPVETRASPYNTRVELMTKYIELDAAAKLDHQTLRHVYLDGFSDLGLVENSWRRYRHFPEMIARHGPPSYTKESISTSEWDFKLDALLGDVFTLFSALSTYLDPDDPLFLVFLIGGSNPFIIRRVRSCEPDYLRCKFLCLQIDNSGAIAKSSIHLAMCAAYNTPPEHTLVWFIAK